MSLLYLFAYLNNHKHRLMCLCKLCDLKYLTDVWQMAMERLIVYYYFFIFFSSKTNDLDND